VIIWHREGTRVNWKIWLLGDEADLEDLCKSFCSSEISILKEDDRYYMKGSLFDSIQEIDELETKAIEVIALLDGAARLGLNRRKPLGISHYSRNSAGGSEQELFVILQDTITIRDSVSIKITHNDGTEEEIHPGDSCLRWMLLSLQNEVIAKVLTLISLDDNSWVGLYRIFEVINADMDIVKSGWATKKSIERFKHTANHPEAAGKESRHGHSKAAPPQHPMSISEARQLIHFIVQNWLNEKANENS